MVALRITGILLMLVSGIFYIAGQNRRVTVADSLTRSGLPNASVFNHRGSFIGTSDNAGTITCASDTDYPITIRYIGYWEKTADIADGDTIFLHENITELPEVSIERKNQKMLHILAYVREYSTLASYTDTVTMFREKMVDFMLPNDDKTSFKGWNSPRILNSKSYYQFTNANGLDSVSDRCNQHFTWSDWLGISPEISLPERLVAIDSGTDTVAGKYTPLEIWVKNRDKVTVDVNVIADTSSTKWVPTIASFFQKNNIDFDNFRLRLKYANVAGDKTGANDLTGYSFNVESRGRGHNMFMFNRHEEPFFVNTYTEVYIFDKEHITVKEAKKWEKRKFNPSEIEISEPAEAPALQPATLALIDRVNNINTDDVRLHLIPDQNLINRNARKGNFSIGKRALDMLKQLTGISSYRSQKNTERHWREFRNENIKRNKPRESGSQE